MRFIDGDRDIRMIVMWSGGIDSTFKLAYLLKETEYQVHAHHVNIVNHEGRARAERAACIVLRRKLKALREFAYTESTVDHSEHEKIPFDMAIVAFEAGVVARSGDGRHVEPFTHWTIGTHKAEGHFQRRFDLYEPMVNAVCFPGDYPAFEMGKVVPRGSGPARRLLVLPVPPSGPRVRSVRNVQGRERGEAKGAPPPGRNGMKARQAKTRATRQTSLIQDL